MNEPLDSSVPQPEDEQAARELKRTPLWGLHQELGARMSPFAGWDMPVRYGSAVEEHLAVRSAAGFFDVGHMAVVDVVGDTSETAAAWLETVVPAGVQGLEPGQMAYTLLTTADGGVLDDLVVSNRGDRFRLVLNAARTEVGLAHLRRFAESVEITHRQDLVVLAFQGPQAVEVLAKLGVNTDDQTFMRLRNDAEVVLRNSSPISCDVARSGYTGEDGFELFVSVAEAEALARALLADAVVSPAGLAARDTLRLEAGLCLWGNDLDEQTSPIEAGLRWSIPPDRRGADAGYLGAAAVAKQIEDGPARRRVGIAAQGRRPIREGADLFLAESSDDSPVGRVTSGSVGPSVGRPIAMGYVQTAHAKAGTALEADVRGRRERCVTERLPFVEHQYKR